MKRIPATITSKGQVTVPAEVRRYLGIERGDKIYFLLEDDGIVRVEVPRYPTVASLRGAAGSLSSPVSWTEIEAIASEDRAAHQSRRASMNDKTRLRHEISESIEPYEPGSE